MHKTVKEKKKYKQTGYIFANRAFYEFYLSELKARSLNEKNISDA